MQLQQTTPDSRAIERRKAPSASREQTSENAPLRALTPVTDLLENDDEVRLRVDLPGVARDAVDLRIERGTLTLTAHRPERNRVYRRAFPIGEGIDPEGIEARLAGGVLDVRLPKREDMKPRRVAIRSGG